MLKRITGILSFLIISSHAIAADIVSCHPKIDTHRPQYIIGYGSLMNKASTVKIRSIAGEREPVLVSGLQRGWFMGTCALPAGQYSATYLGVKRRPSATMNAVVFHLKTAEHVAEYDKREHLYCRAEIKASKIKFLATSKPKMGQYWVYLVPEQRLTVPAVHCPIVQSYVDVFLTGCLDVEKKYHLSGFAEQCITTTKAWSKHWVNDRIYPRRPFIHQPNAFQIDRLLVKRLPDFIKYRVIE